MTHVVPFGQASMKGGNYMKSFPKLLALILTICLVGGSSTIVSAQDTTTSSSNNVQNQGSSVNPDIKTYTYSLSIGDTKDVTIKLAQYYSVKGKDVISVTRSKKTLNIEAIAEGEASITLKNAKKKVIAKILITVDIGELIEDTDDSADTDAVTSASLASQTPAQNVKPTQAPVNVQPTQPAQNIQPTQAPVQHEEGSNRPLYNGVVYLTIGVKSAITQMPSSVDNETINLSMSDGYIAAVNNGDTVSAIIENGTLYITLKKTSDPYVIVADAHGKAIYRIHILPVQ